MRRRAVGELVLLNLALAGIFAWLVRREGTRYLEYIPALLHVASTVFTNGLKNQTGNLTPTLLGNLSSPMYSASKSQTAFRCTTASTN